MDWKKVQNYKAVKFLKKMPGISFIDYARRTKKPKTTKEYLLYGANLAWGIIGFKPLFIIGALVLSDMDSCKEKRGNLEDTLEIKKDALDVYSKRDYFYPETIFYDSTTIKLLR